MAARRGDALAAALAQLDKGLDALRTGSGGRAGATGAGGGAAPQTGEAGEAGHGSGDAATASTDAGGAGQGGENVGAAGVPAAPATGGCDCGVSGGRPTGGALMLSLLGLVCARRTRRRS